MSKQQQQEQSPTISVPPGRSLADVPKGAPKPIPPTGARPPNARLTLKNLITENETKEYLVPLLVQMGNTRNKGPWREYLAFYRANQSGDVDAMSAEVRQKCEKLVKDLNDEYFKQQDL